MIRTKTARRLHTDDMAGSPIRRIMELADRKNIVAMGLDPDDVISFAGGWVNHAAPEPMRRAYERIARDAELFHQNGAYSPTMGLPSLREALVRLDRRLYGTPGLEVDNVMVGQSSTQLTYCLLMALLDPGDRVLLFDPAYANYAPQIKLFSDDIEIVSVPVLDTESWEYFADVETTVEALEAAIAEHRPKLLLFSTPDNPTGRLVPDAAFEPLLRAAAAAGCFVAIDYAYRAQYFGAEQPMSYSIGPATHENLIRIHSNSKWCRGLGRRLGWIEARPDVIEALSLVQQSVILCPDTLHQNALAMYLDAALEDGSLSLYLDQSRQAYATAAAAMSRNIETYLGMRYLEPQGSLYTVVDVGRDGNEFVDDVLRNTGVIFVPGTGFGETLRNAVRISFGPLVHDPARMEEGFARVGAYLRGTPGSSSAPC